MNSHSPVQTDKEYETASKSPLAVSGAVLLAALIVWWWTGSWYEQRLLTDMRRQVQSTLTPYSQALNSAIRERLTLLTGLQAFVSSHIEEDAPNHHLETFAAGLHAGTEGVRAVQVFPLHGKVQVYPLRGNEATQDRTLDDLLTDKRPQVREDVLRAVRSGRPTLSGPYELRQGGLGLVTRQAVFHEGELRGITVIVFDLPPILKLAGLAPPPDEIRIGLRDEKGHVFAGDPTVFDAAPVFCEIALPERSWHLAAVPLPGWGPNFTLRIFQGGGLIVVFLLTALTHSLASRTTELKRRVALRTRALRNSEKRFKTIFDEAPIGVALVNDSGRVDEVNPRFAEITGRTPKELADIELITITHPEDMLEIRKNMSLMYSGKISGFSLEKRCVRPDESSGWVHMTMAPTTVTHMDRPHHLCMIQDINERRESEKERELLQAQLAQAQKMESVGRLAGGVAHDFNNMLGVILGHAEVALNKVDPTQPLHSNLQNIRKAAERSADLTRQLLAFARKQTITPRRLDLNQTLKGMLSILQRLIGEDIDLVWLPGPDLWPVAMDPTQIDQILANLCLNARDAIQGVGNITIATKNMVVDEETCANHTDCSPGEYVLLIVNDDGCGMDKETLTNIFEPFFTTKKTGKGTGLGMATVYGIVRQNNGFINVYSEPNEGTDVKIYLPRLMGTAERVPEAVRSAPRSRENETVLLVEDEPLLLEMTEEMLERLGYAVLTAPTPTKALELAENHKDRIHVLITDVIMPEMNGPDLAARILPLRPALKCIFISGYTADVIDRHGVLDEDVHFIQKPFSRQELATKLRRVLDE